MKAGSSGRHFNALPVLLAGISAYILISGVIYLFKESYSLDNASFLLLNSISEAIAFGGIYLLLKERFPLRFRFSTSAFVYGLASWLVVFVFTQAYFFCVRALGFEPDLYQHEIFKGIDSFAHSAVAFLSVAVLPPFFEELYFRGMLFSYLREKHGFFISALASSAVFGILHGAFYFLPLFLFGVVLCYLTEKTGSIGAALFSHGLNNAIAFFYYLYLSGG